jgi:hypothetical protein
MDKHTKSSSMDYRVQGYVRPQHKELLKGYKDKYDVSESKIVSMALKNFFDGLPNDEKVRLLSRAKVTHSHNQY